MGTHYRGSEKEVRALDAYIKLMRASTSVTSRVHRKLLQRRLTVSQFGTLEALHHLGPLSQGALGRKILKTSGNITVVIDNLERRGLVRRERDQRDRRCVTVHLTDAGRETIEEIFPVHVETIVNEMSSLTGPEQEDLARLCKRLGLAQGEGTSKPKGET